MMNPVEYVVAYVVPPGRWMVYRPDAEGGALVGEVTIAYHPLPKPPLPKYWKRSEVGYAARSVGDRRWCGPFKTFAEAQAFLAGEDVKRNFDVVV